MKKALFVFAAVGAVTAGAIYSRTDSPQMSAITPMIAAADAAPAGAGGADARHPVVLELFQSQGCSSCPPANIVLDQIANRPDVLALNFSVTYWDQLGWKDIYGQQAFTDRQWAYEHAQGRNQVQTPQLIVNGRGAVLGSFRNEVDQAIVKYGRGTSGPTIEGTGTKVSIGSGTTATPATVWLIDYDPRTLNVPIRSGENGGRTLPHRNIVKRLTPIGSWTGKATQFGRLPALQNTVQAVLVQSGKAGPILSAAKL